MAKGQNALHSKVNKKATRGNASARGRRGKATKPKVRYSKRSVASTTIRRERSPRAAARNARHKNEVPANSHIDATLPGTQGSEARGAAARLESSPKTISILGVFYELSRARMAIAQISAQKLQRSFVALIGCRSPQEFFQVQKSAGEGASRTVCRQHLCPVPQSDQAQLRASGSVVNVSFRKKGAINLDRFFKSGLSPAPANP